MGQTHQPNQAAERNRSWLSRNVIVLGFVSLLTDTASEMVIPLLPIYLTVTLGAGAFVLGWIEGAAEAIASVLKLLAGRWSDKIGKSRPFVIVGYALSSLARPLIALAMAPWHVLAVRCTDRVGKGLRTSPRDALISASVLPAQRGAAFGLHRAMDHAGAVIGPLVAAAFLIWVSEDLRLLFWLTAIPGLAVVIVAWFGVREAPRIQETKAAEPVHHKGLLLRFLVPLALFTLGRASDVFLLLKAAGDSELYMFPLLWVGLHVVRMLASVPGGKLADRWGRRRTIAAGWLVFAVVFAALGFVEDRKAVYGLIALYGIYSGLTESAEKALVADIAPRRKQGTAFGWYHVVLGLLTMAASVLFGALWQFFSSRVAFLTSAGLAAAAVIALAVLARPGRPATPAPSD